MPSAEGELAASAELAEPLDGGVQSAVADVDAANGYVISLDEVGDGVEMPSPIG